MNYAKKTCRMAHMPLTLSINYVVVFWRQNPHRSACIPRISPLTQYLPDFGAKNVVLPGAHVRKTCIDLPAASRSRFGAKTFVSLRNDARCLRYHWPRTTAIQWAFGNLLLCGHTCVFWRQKSNCARYVKMSCIAQQPAFYRRRSSIIYSKGLCANETVMK